MTPKHVAIIPDGNRRWSKERGLFTFQGHKKGFEQAFEITQKARDLGIKVLTLWAFSTDNWKRQKKEIEYLMRLYSQMVDKYLKDALKNEVRIIHLGRKDRINENLKKKVIEAEEKTSKFSRHYLCIALDYGGRDEIVRAINKMKKEKGKRKNFIFDSLEKYLDTKDLPYPDVDLVIRTSGETRTSGFMLWQTALSEYIFYPKHFPDFAVSEFEKCIKEFENRKRRFGK